MSQKNSRLKVCSLRLLLVLFLSFAVFEAVEKGGAHDLLLKWFRNQPPPNDLVQKTSIAQANKMRQPIRASRLATPIHSARQSRFSVSSPDVASMINRSDVAPTAPPTVDITLLELPLVIEPHQLNVSVPWKGTTQQTLMITILGSWNQEIKLIVPYETSWLAVEPASNTLAPSSQVVITVTLDANSLDAAGEHHIDLMLETSQKTITVPIKLTVRPPQEQPAEAQTKPQTSKIVGSGSFGRERPEPPGEATSTTESDGASGGTTSQGGSSASRLSRTRSSSDDHGNDRETGSRIRSGDLIEGVISPEGDVDYFLFDARAGDVISLEIQSERLRIGFRLDSYITLYAPDGSHLTSNDDSWDGRNFSHDSRISNFQLPSTGEYALSVKDFYNGGGPDYGYFLILWK